MSAKGSKIAQAATKEFSDGFEDQQIQIPPPPPPPTPQAVSDLRQHIGKTVTLPIERLFIKDNVRKTIDLESDNFQALYKSIEEDGLFQNLTGEVTKDGLRVCIRSGQRRLLACRLLKMPKVSVRLTEFNNNGQRKVHELVENILRAELNSIDTADGFKDLVEHGWTTITIAEKFGRSEQTIKKYLQIASWSDAAKNFARENIELFPVVLLFNQISKAEHEDSDLLIAKLRNIKKRSDNDINNKLIQDKRSDSIDQLPNDSKKLVRESLLKEIIGAKSVVASQKPGKDLIRVTLTFENNEAFDSFTQIYQDYRSKTA